MTLPVMLRANPSPKSLAPVYEREIIFRVLQGLHGWMLRDISAPEDEIKERWQEQLREMAHSHYAKFPLTTTNERNTFLHGTMFIGQAEESWSW